MSTNNENPTTDRKSGAAAKTQTERDNKANRESDADTRNFIETHNVTKVARKAVPGSGEESADLSESNPSGGSAPPAR